MQSDQIRNTENAKFGKIYMTVRSTQKYIKHLLKRISQISLYVL